MKIAMINGSPKSKDSTSGQILKELKTCLNNDVTYTDYQFNKPQPSEDALFTLNDFDVLVFAFPLYVDGIPSHLLSCLKKIQQSGLSNKNITVYCIVNSGFYDGIQNSNAVEILHNWCRHMGLKWGMGVGIGGGGALLSMSGVPLGKGPKKSIGLAFTQLAKNIEQKSSSDNIYTNINFPRFLYKIMAQLGWRQLIKLNGKKTRDLNYRY
jgi:multimeric flavodoxin WrbA